MEDRQPGYQADHSSDAEKDRTPTGAYRQGDWSVAHGQNDVDYT